MDTLTPTSGVHAKPIDPQTRLAPDSDGQEQGGEALDRRQQPQPQKQALEQVLGTLGRLAERHQQSAAAVQAFARNGTPQQLQDVADTAVAVGQQAHLLEAGLREFAVLGFVDTRDVRMFKGDTMAQLRQLEVPPPLTQEVLSQSNGSNDFFEQLLAMIGQIRGEYLAVYEAVLKKYSDFYTEFNKEIMANMGDWIKGQDDGKKVFVSAYLKRALKKLIDKYDRHPDGTLYPLPDEHNNYPKPTQADALKWAKAMGLKESAVVALPGGGYRVQMDLSALTEMYKSTRDPGEDWDSAKFQAWQTGFNSQEGELKNQLQVLTTKYGNANSYHENFNKILSSQLSQYAEMLKAYLQGLS